MNLRLEIADLNAALDKMRLAYPELAEDEQLRADCFDAETPISDVLSKLVDIVKDAEMNGAAVKLRIDELKERRARWERKVDAVRAVIEALMERADIKKFVLPEATLVVTYRPPQPIIVDESALPDECLRIKKEPNLTLIKAWCTNGNRPDGVSMSNGSTTLTIRTA